ncbi:hypothetical protein CB0940_11222 [Cercospora beticola]|uniref:Cyanovirin-N domain-containing protein n=1 Tax=Cercospora beticola TaxID=122368 RepID=A0A2G5HF09_CERBT|nr:hypothetical protein CB0940_11222 [Cercospora beticola]PIA90812.1 hypothetical protein CB0940_11222 [Cercospora beticola]WPB08054.1 hypothetical protein RHO25_012718 [Cercospora beticola]CAK1368084.1 unnamed protein product [Cercospora beticola]
MKTLPTLLPTLLLTLTTAQTPDQDFQYSAACGAKNPAVNQAIAAFCHKKDKAGNYADTITCPGSRSETGVVKEGIRAKITGNCTPKQWVPGKFCLLQFHYICATGDAKGLGTGTYGTNGCQKWTLEEAVPNVPDILGAFGLGKRGEEEWELELEGEEEK